MNPTVKEPKKRFMTLKRREACLGWLFVSPALIGFSIFTFGSILYSFYLSLTDYDLLSAPKWVGFDNYIRAFTKDQYFYKYFGNTLYFVVTLVPIVLALSLLLAILINKKTSWVNNIYRVALFLPSITSTVAVSMVWLWIFNPDMGLINNFLMAIGLNDVPMWLGDTAWSKPALVIMRVWQMGGYYMIMFLAGLQTIPETLYEAAELDGASEIQKFFRITLPLLSNTTFVVMILLVIEAFNMFESIFIMTAGGPLGSTSTMMYYIYEQAFSSYNMGYEVHFTFIAVKHLIESYGVRISAEGKTFAYSGDTGVCEGLYKVASGADAFLCESTFCAGETAEESHHLSAHTAAQTAKDAGVKQLFMTHYHSEQSQALLQEARQVFPDAVLTQIESAYAVGEK